MSTIALLCVVALVAVVIVGIVGAASSGTASLDDVYARHRSRQAALDDGSAADGTTTDPWVTDARAHPGGVPQQRTAADRPADRQPA